MWHTTAYKTEVSETQANQKKLANATHKQLTLLYLCPIISIKLPFSRLI